MSTKIYNAYKFNGSIEDLMSVLKDYRKKWMEIHLDYYYDRTKLLDKDQFAEFSKNFEDSIKKEHKTWLDDAIDGSCVVIPHKSLLYVIFYATASVDIEGKKAVDPDKDERFQDYHYQNQSDAWYEYDDEGGGEKLNKEERKAAEKDWEEREVVWEEIFNESWTPSEVGFVYEFAGTKDVWKFLLELRKMRRNKDGK